VRKQVFEHPDWVAHDQTLRARNRTDGPVLRQPVRCGDDLTVVQTEETVVGKSEAWNLETTCGAKLECPLRQQAVQCVVDVRVFDEVATRIHFEHSLETVCSNEVYSESVASSHGACA